MDGVRPYELFICCLLAVCLPLGVSSSARGESRDLHISPEIVNIGAFFDGARVGVSGEIPEGCDAVVEVTGKDSEQDLMRKGRRWELWMNVGEIDIESAPSLYLAMSSDPSLLSANEKEHPWGYQALGRSVSFKGQKLNQEQAQELFRQFVQLKESHGLYGSYPGKVAIERSGVGHLAVSANFRLPVRISPGTYQVCLLMVQGGALLQRQCVPLNVQTVGLPAFLNSLARKNAPLYGFLAIFIAMIAGLSTGFIFKKIFERKEEKC